MRKTGRYVKLGNLEHFIPNPLPPQDPKLELTEKLMNLYGEAIYELGQLNEMSNRLQDPERFINAYVTKEALLTSEIEGIHTTLVDVYECVREGKKADKDTQLVLNYMRAVKGALELIQEKNLPVVSRVILKAHKILLSEGEGDKKAPGSYRKQGVRVGNLVPPPVNEVERLIGDLEKFINESSDLPVLIRAGLAHVQFETIHPFLDGNGRIGRLLIVLMLLDSELLSIPVLYPSYYFKKFNLEYYQRLDAVRTHGDFEGWIAFYLKGIAQSAADAHKRAKALEELEVDLRKRIKESEKFKKSEDTALQVLDVLFSNPITDVSKISAITGKAYNTVSNILNDFIEMKIIKVSVAKKRNKLFRFDLYLSLLEKDFS